jgi:uncharacterized protein (TIGR02001 family)
MNKTLTTIAAATLMASSGMAMAEVTMSGNVALTSDYQFRGITQTDEDPAVQGGFDVEHSSGLYAGVWASNVDFEIQTVDDAQLELDVYAGFSGSMTDKLGFDVGVLDYNYPGADGSLKYDFTEVYGSLSYDFGPAAVTVGVNVSNDYFAGSGDSTWTYASLDIPLQNDFALAASYGDMSIDDNATWGTPDYNAWTLGISKELAGFGFDLTYSDTDLSKTECFGGSDWCSDRLIFTISKSL